MSSFFFKKPGYSAPLIMSVQGILMVDVKLRLLSYSAKTSAVSAYWKVPSEFPNKVSLLNKLTSWYYVNPTVWTSVIVPLAIYFGSFNRFLKSTAETSVCYLFIVSYPSVKKTTTILEYLSMFYTPSNLDFIFENTKGKFSAPEPWSLSHSWI